MDTVLDIDLPTIKGDRIDLFARAISAPVAFDYFGLERGGHYAVLKWLLTCGPQPHMAIPGCGTAKPRTMWYHSGGWFTTAAPPPQSVALIYNVDSDISSVTSRLPRPKTIICVRDIRNLLASRLMWHRKNHRQIFRTDTLMLFLWEKYAKQVLGDEDYFDGQAVGIVYDKWFSSEQYCVDLITQLNSKFGWNLTPTGERGLVQPQAGGSSFDGTTLENEPEKMKVLERWKQIEPIALPPHILELNDRLLAP